MPHIALFFEILLLTGYVTSVLLFFWIWKWEKKAWRALFLIGILFGVGAVTYGCFIETRRIVVRDFQIENTDLPEMKVAVVADFHVGPYKKARFVERVVHQLNQLDVDLVLMPGDFLFGKAERYADQLEPLKHIRHKVFATLGNHDHRINDQEPEEHAQLLRSVLHSLNVQDLRNTTAFHPQKDLYVAGIDDNYLGYHDLPKALRAIPDGAPFVLLSHSPDILNELDEDQIPSLIVSGHTHCGQIRVPGYGAVPGTIPTETGKQYERHLYELEDANYLFVTCGVGETGTRMRLFNPPEIAVLEIGK